MSPLQKKKNIVEFSFFFRHWKWWEWMEYPVKPEGGAVRNVDVDKLQIWKKVVIYVQKHEKHKFKFMATLSPLPVNALKWLRNRNNH